MVDKDQLNAMAADEAAKVYLAEGGSPIPVPRRGSHKDPGVKNWQKHRFTHGEFEPDDNIGLKLGAELRKGFYVIDIDLDLKMSGASAVLDAMLPTSSRVFGRPSAPRSHRLYLATRPLVGVRYHGVGDLVVIEIRGVNRRASSPQQTIVPPSVHASGEPITYDEYGDWPTIDADGLEEAVKFAAVALVLLQVWPALGKRHNARLAWAKALHQRELPADVTKRIMIAVTAATDGDVSDAAQCVADTLAKAPEDTVGASYIVEQLQDGAAALRAIDKILGRKRCPQDAYDVSELNLNTLTPPVWARVSGSNAPVTLMLQGGLPVRIAAIPHGGASHRRPTSVLQPLDADRLRHEVAQRATFVGGKQYRQVPPPRDLIADMLATEPRRVPLPTVTRITHAPVLAVDGTIDLRPGYQPATGVYYVDDGLVIPPVADGPTADDVRRAVAVLSMPLQDFAFVSDADYTAAAACLLLPFVRTLIDGPTPLHLIKKPVAGAGATLLSDTLLYPAVGTDIARMSTVQSDDEWRKQITATLLDGPAVVCVDNARELTSPQLAKAITDNVWQARILGVSRNAVLRVECVWVATGINPDLHSEVARRIVPCRLDPRVEQPWLRRDFRIADLRSWSRQHRGEMVWAALTVARAWFVAGQPAGDQTLGMFEGWSHVIGGILKHAGLTGFLGNLQEVYDEADVEGDAVHWFLSEWNRQHGSIPVRITDTALWALRDGSPMLELMAVERGRSERYAKWVRRLQRRVVEIDGRPVRIEPVSTHSSKTRNHTWRLICVDGRPLPRSVQVHRPGNDFDFLWPDGSDTSDSL